MINLDDAIKTHAEWKVKFRAAIAGKKALDAAIIAKDNECMLGKWLHGEAKAKYAGLKAYDACVHAHATFHTQAGKVASIINAGQFVEAEAAIAGNTPYGAASSAIGLALIGLRKEAGI